MEIAKIIREDFLQQNAFSSWDFTCPIYKSIGMLRNIVTLYKGSQKLIAESSANAKVTWAYIKTSMDRVIKKVIDGKFLDPKLPKEEIQKHYHDIDTEIEMAFQTICGP